jgi:hypothetical protein
MIGNGQFRLPEPEHRSTHKVTFESASLGTYVLSVYRGHNGPVVVFEEGENSDLPLEYMSLGAAGGLAPILNDPLARFFERHWGVGPEVWVELEPQRGQGYKFDRSMKHGGPELIMEALGEQVSDGGQGTRRRPLHWGGRPDGS